MLLKENLKASAPSRENSFLDTSRCASVVLPIWARRSVRKREREREGEREGEGETERDRERAREREERESQRSKIAEIDRQRPR